jgi:type I restriction enzyme S subunit
MTPEEWKSEPLVNHVTLLSGQHIKARDCSSEPTGVPYLTGPADLVAGRIRVTKYTRTPKVVCKSGDILITVKGSGTGTIFFADDDYCISRQLMAVRPREWDPKFLYHALNLRAGSYRQNASGLIPGVSREDILSTHILVPPPTEQKRIVDILATWDRAIDQLSHLIEAKRRLKKGLMQQLLTGTKRFPQFAGIDWEECHLGDLFDERNEVDRGDLPLLSITSDRGVIYRDEIDKRDNSNADKSKYKRIAPGDIGYNTMRMWQGVSALSSLEGIVSPAYTVCTPKAGMCAECAQHLFKFPAVVHLFHRYSQGLVSDTLSLKFPQFATIKVTIPSVEEQRRIASVLDAADREVVLLRRDLDALKTQKKGLMQKLLTGQIPVKV